MNGRTYDNSFKEAAFPLGGIGTGNVSLGARGELRDWEIFNRPAKGGKLPHTFFALWVKEAGKHPVSRVLEAELVPPYGRDSGIPSSEAGGLPRLASSKLSVEYPFAEVVFYDETLPLAISLEAFTPFIPLDPEGSGIPGVCLRYRVQNQSDASVDLTIAGSMANASTLLGYDELGYARFSRETVNTYREGLGCRGLSFTPAGTTPKNSLYGSMALVTTGSTTTYKGEWLEGGWFDGIQDFWNDFREDGKLERESAFDAEGNAWIKPTMKVGSLGVREVLKPGEEKTVEFVLTWHFPRRLRGWDEGGEVSPDSFKKGLINNHYATIFNDAWHAAEYLVKELPRLEDGSRKFQKALHGSSLPEYVVDALASNISVIRSTTCFRIEDGSFLGWEGSHDTKGSCFGSCTHVWNYAQTLAFLFPTLEQTMRKTEFLLETDEDGSMAFRTKQLFGEEKWDLPPAVDGQLGTIVRLYREWKLTGDNDFLAELAEKAFKALDFALNNWDTDGNYVLDGKQHNTYDIEFHGPNPLGNSMLLAALKAGEEIASFLWERGGSEEYRERAKKYGSIFKEAQGRVDTLLWNGEYYSQKLPDVNAYRYQFGEGCLSDQLMGQFLAHTAGLGYVLPEEHVKKAVRSIYTYNFIKKLRNHENVQRTYALNDEGGLVLCTWPKGGRPRLPFVYSDEVWTGVEYEAAALLIYEGWTEEGLEIVKAVRERFDGKRRNPWDEYETGHHYARALSSWALLTALSGFRYDMTEGAVHFHPVIRKDDFTTFWSTGKAWGTYSQKKNRETGKMEKKLTVLYGDEKAVRLEPLPGTISSSSREAKGE